MNSTPARRRHLASSPFQPKPDPVIEQYECGDLVSHDAYGMGRVIGSEDVAVTVDFGTRKLRIPSTDTRLSKL